MQNNWKKAEEVLKKDGVVVLPTDTLYGIVGKALSRKTIERIYEIKGRDRSKPFIVLISSYKDLEIFGVKITKEQAKILPKFWPGKVTIILPCLSKKFEYLHRGTKSIAFRMIGKKNHSLSTLLKKVGPLVAPSVNPENLKHAETIKEAKNYFGNKIDIYLNSGPKIGKSSTLAKFENDKLIVLRQGQVKVK
ncbi:MAG TPA: L-threonylcarbamoyladenylate synthase [Candidatus Paceibacterota bacterium]|nr:L-threonylcarbamoyladenylate synthase [Candidatus Paceibacterota bacterium]